jgi:AhpD family alkylhydroperoxidase
MARIPYPNLDELHPSVREAFEALPAKLNIFRMLAHAERNFSAFTRFGGTILGRQQLDAKLRELAILHVAQLSGARYEWDQHVPIAERTGVRPEQIAALEAGNASADCFDASEALVLRFTGEVLRDVRASDETFAALAKQLPHREVVELVLAVGFYMLVARLLETTGVDLEAPAGDAIVDQLRQPE